MQKTVSFGLRNIIRSDDARKQKGEVEVLWTGAGNAESGINGHCADN